jgi:hypothetical protein
VDANDFGEKKIVSKTMTEPPRSAGSVNKRSITQLAFDHQTSGGHSQYSLLYKVLLA